MTRYWVQFAWLGTPNWLFSPFWPQYEPQTDRILSLAPTGPEVVTDFADDHQCDFWTPPTF